MRPIPDTASLTIRIFTFDQPSLQSSGNANLDTPSHFHKDIVNFIVSNMAAKDGNMQAAQYYNNIWLTAVKKAKMGEKGICVI